MTAQTAARALLASLAMLVSGWAQAADRGDPAYWLERMATAMNQMDYQGTFVYLQGSQVETLRITHVSGEEGVRERLSSLSGPKTEVLRDPDGVRWVLGDAQSVFADSAFNRSFFTDLPLEQGDLARESYVLKLSGSDRIAGQKVRKLDVVPKDRYRYGYSLWLEEHSGLLLKWELNDARGNPLAKLMFTDIRLGSEVDRRELEPGSQMKNYRTVESALPPAQGRATSRPGWQPARLPNGFRLVTHRSVEKQPGQVAFEHLVFSDGLVAVSVYVEEGVEDAETETGFRRFGTTNAFSRLLDDKLITVVGDVPSITVRTIADSVEPVSP